MTYQRQKEMVESWGVSFCCTRMRNGQRAGSQLGVHVLRASWDIYKMSNRHHPFHFLPSFSEIMCLWGIFI